MHLKYKAYMYTAITADYCQELLNLLNRSFQGKMKF